MGRKLVIDKRIIDTFAARDLSVYDKKPSIYSVIEASMLSGEDLSAMRRKRKRLARQGAR